MEANRHSRPGTLPAVPYPQGGAFAPGFGFGSDGATGDEQNPLVQYLAVIQRYWWLIVLTTVLAVAYQYYKTRNDLPQFRSSSAVRLTDQGASVSGNLVPDYANGYGGYTDPILTQVQVIKSRIIAEQVVDSLGLQLQSATPGFYMGFFRDVHVSASAPPATLTLHFSPSHFTVYSSRDSIIGDYGRPVSIGRVAFTVPQSPGFMSAVLRVIPREQAVDEVQAGLDVKPRDMTSVIDIIYTGDDPYVAQDVASAVALVYKAQDAASARQQSHRRRVFIESQLRTTDSALAVAQARIAAYRKSNLALSAQDKYNAEQTDLTSLSKRAEALRESRASYQSLLAALQRYERGDVSALRTLAFVVDPGGNASVNTLFRQLEQYEQTRDSLTTGMFARTPEHPAVERMDALIASTEPKLRTAVENQIAVIDGEIATIDTLQSHRREQIAAIPGVEETEQRLERDADNILKMSDKLNDELQLAKIAEAVEAGQVEIVDLAQYPSGSIGAGRRRKLAYGAFLGVLLGIALTVLVDRMSSTVRRWEDLERVMRVPGLALIPQIAGDAGDGWQARVRGTAHRLLPSLVPQRGLVGDEVGNELVMVNDVRSSSAESYRKLMTNLMYSASRPGLRVVVVTSASAGEGKTTTVSNLAVAFAQQGRRVVLIDADLRRARIHDVFGLGLEPGLTDVLVGNATLEQSVRPSGIAGLSIIPAGTLPPNPLEFLGGERMHELLGTLRERYDVVLIDTPPVLVTADAALMGVQADGVVLVVRAGKSERVAARHAVEQIVHLGGRMLGAVLNDPDARTPRYGRYGDYYYGYGYTASET
ncbi:MAG: polysaccharide biosynthesis tyrosine autokinase [Gemmatimonadota bacterium]|nr:polysaccharide biosynthesis tyrosine autokinase [Gemmatimonadota bacterium]